MKERCTNLNYLNKWTKSNPLLIEEMIRLYLEEIPQILKAMNQNLEKRNWQGLSNTIHKLIPSFSLVGIDIKYENMARMAMDCASMNDSAAQLDALVSQLDNICHQALEELNEELNILKK